MVRHWEAPDSRSSVGDRLQGRLRAQGDRLGRGPVGDGEAPRATGVPRPPARRQEPNSLGRGRTPEGSQPARRFREARKRARPSGSEFPGGPARARKRLERGPRVAQGSGAHRARRLRCHLRSGMGRCARHVLPVQAGRHGARDGRPGDGVDDDHDVSRGRHGRGSANRPLPLDHKGAAGRHAVLDRAAARSGPGRDLVPGRRRVRGKSAPTGSLMARSG